MVRIGKWSAVAVVALAAASVGAASVAQDKAALIKDRQDFMKAQAADTKAINDYAKGMGDKASAQKAADDLIVRSAKIPSLFPAGTSTTEFPGKTNAKPEIWTDRAKFEAVPVALKGLATKISATIKTGTPADVGLAAADLGKNGCGACHSQFRVPLQH